MPGIRQAVGRLDKRWCIDDLDSRFQPEGEV